MPCELPRLSRCCFCLPLRIGALIIGYSSIFIACLYLSMISVSLFEVVTKVRENQSPPSAQHNINPIGLYITHAYYFLVFTYLLVVSMLLVIGAHKRKPHYMRYYFNFAMFLLALALVLVVVTFVFAGFLVTLPLLKWCLIHFFCLLVVRSSYLEMEEQDKPPNYQMNTIIYNPHQTQPLMA